VCVRNRTMVRVVNWSRELLHRIKATPPFLSLAINIIYIQYRIRYCPLAEHRAEGAARGAVILGPNKKNCLSFFLVKSIIYIYIYILAMSDIYCACDILCNIFLRLFRVVFLHYDYYCYFIILFFYFLFFCSRGRTTITIEFESRARITMGIRRDQVSRLFRRSPTVLQDERRNDSAVVHILTRIRERRTFVKTKCRTHYTRQCTRDTRTTIILYVRTTGQRTMRADTS